MLNLTFNLRDPDITGARMKVSNLEIAQAIDFFVAGDQVIGTTEELIDLTGLTAAGIGAILVRADQANNVQIGLKPGATFFPFAELVPGEFPLMVPFENLNIWGKALVAPVTIQRLMFDA